MPTAVAWKQAAKQYHNFIGGQIELQHQTEKDYRTLQREQRALRETARALAQAMRELLWTVHVEGCVAGDAYDDAINGCRDLLASSAVRDLLESGESKE
jgi:hypothetical protein